MVDHDLLWGLVAAFVLAAGLGFLFGDRLRGWLERWLEKSTLRLSFVEQAILTCSPSTLDGVIVHVFYRSGANRVGWSYIREDKIGSGWWPPTDALCACGKYRQRDLVAIVEDGKTKCGVAPEAKP